MPATIISNIEWLSVNARRNYPLEDWSTKQDDTGKELPDELIVDMNLWFPASVAGAAFISSVTITDKLITLTIASVPSRPLQGSPITPAFVPLAALTVVKPVIVCHNYRFRGFTAGVGGWLMLGSHANGLANGSWRFSDPAATAILPRVTRSYPSLGVTSLGKRGFANILTGLVTLQSSNPDTLVIEKSIEQIPGVGVRKAIAFRLNDEVSGQQIYSLFPGLCGGVPESNGCKGPTIQSINGVTPDCDGVITLHIQEIIAPGNEADLTLSYADTNQDDTEPVGSGKGHTLNFEYNLGMQDICQPVPNQFTKDQADACENPCAPFSAPSPLVGTDMDVTWGWSSGTCSEPSPNSNSTFSVVSSICKIDLSLYDSLTFNGDSQGVTWMMPASAVFVQNPSATGYTIGSPVNFTLPSTAQLFYETSGALCTKGTMSNNTAISPNVTKQFSNGIDSFTVPAGNATNDGTLHVGSFPSSFSKLNWGITLSPTNLEDAGLVVDGCLLVRFVHVVSGRGFADVRIKGNASSADPNIDPGCDGVSNSSIAPPEPASSSSSSSVSSSST